MDIRHQLIVDILNIERGDRAATEWRPRVLRMLLSGVEPSTQFEAIKIYWHGMAINPADADWILNRVEIDDSILVTGQLYTSPNP